MFITIYIAVSTYKNPEDLKEMSSILIFSINKVSTSIEYKIPPFPTKWFWLKIES